MQSLLVQGQLTYPLDGWMDGCRWWWWWLRKSDALIIEKLLVSWGILLITRDTVVTVVVAVKP